MAVVERVSVVRRRPSMSTLPEIGAPAPDFTLSSHLEGDVQLSAMRGTKVAILFYPFDFSPG
jgi:peroxiredoxin